MKMKIVTTITSLVDIDTMQPEHSVDINDEDGLSEVSAEVAYAVVIGGLRATENGIIKKFPRLARKDA